MGAVSKIVSVALPLDNTLVYYEEEPRRAILRQAAHPRRGAADRGEEAGG
jgi:hypothetical protein